LSIRQKRKFTDLQRRLQCVEDENQELIDKVARLQTSNDDLTHRLCSLESSESQIKELKQSLAVEQSKYIALLAERNITDFQLTRANETISLNSGIVAQLELKTKEYESATATIADQSKQLDGLHQLVENIRSRFVPAFPALRASAATFAEQSSRFFFHLLSFWPAEPAYPDARVTALVAQVEELTSANRAYAKEATELQTRLHNRR